MEHAGGVRLTVWAAVEVAAEAEAEEDRAEAVVAPEEAHAEFAAQRIDFGQLGVRLLSATFAVIR